MTVTSAGSSATIPRVGDLVTTVSGRHLGRVLQVEAAAFRMQLDNRDVWLQRDVIFTVVGHEVSLICERGGVDHYSV